MDYGFPYVHLGPVCDDVPTTFSLRKRFQIFRLHFQSEGAVSRDSCPTVLKVASQIFVDKGRNSGGL